ncbi:hypothetical protein TsFJ059_006077 [Trichoderma semiorbis]|uniref:Uncharacterized protein n=1 Tax=Trichoderma semiorbis TaxID=1491008 RepID=A0A9P8KKC5_9HYPO|nr:hypothetical protein TsFJ059_006077 [Trichoderma semiorbis]
MAASNTVPLKCMSANNWFLGLPIPDSEKPPDAVEGWYEPQPLTPPNLITPEMINEWLFSSNRPRFARLLDFGRLDRSCGLLSSYLGFSTLQHFYYFIDFIAPRVISPIIGLVIGRKREGDYSIMLPRRALL